MFYRDVQLVSVVSCPSMFYGGAFDVAVILGLPLFFYVSFCFTTDNMKGFLMLLV